MVDLPLQQQPKKVIVIGGGLAGLAACYDLARQNVQVTLVEESDQLGGLAGSIPIKGQSVDRYYHFLCRNDHEIISLARELGINDSIHWMHTRTAFYYHGHLYPFGTPLDLVRFSAIPFLQRFRFGTHILYSRYRSVWKWLDQIPAKPWLIENIGEQAYDVIWNPLLQVKFGKYHEKISAAWIWHRIWRVAKSRQTILSPEKFGYFNNGSKTLVDKIDQFLESSPNVTILKRSRVKSIQVENNKVISIQVNNKTIWCDAIISTVALPILLSLLPKEKSEYFNKASQIQYIGVVCMLLNLRKPFSNNYWTNINDPRISFNGIIEYTNLNTTIRRDDLNLLYVPYYLSTSEPRFHYDDESLFQEYVTALKCVNPQFSEDWVTERYVFRDSYAQAICTTDFQRLIPDIRSSIQGLLVTDSAQFYPEDRTLSAAIRQGRAAAEMLIRDL
jgi:protoporphyrinogen oxidase